MITLTEKNQLIVENAIPIIRNGKIVKFLTNISIAEVARIYENLVYDQNTQRGYKEIKHKKGCRKEKIMYRESIEEMKDKALSGFFDGGTLTWNVRKDDKDKDFYSYSPEEGKVIIQADKITLPDSYHRHTALKELAHKEGVNADENYFPLSISMYNYTEEQMLFSEINGSGTNVSKTRSLFLSNTPKSKMIKELIEESDLKNNVDIVNGRSTQEKLMNFAILYDSIFNKRYGAFRKIEKREELDALKKWLIRFYNYIIDLRDEWKLTDLKTRKEYKSSSIGASGNMIIAMAFVAKELRDDSNWKSKVSRINNPYKYGAYKGDLFSVTNPLWSQTLTHINISGELRPANYSTSKAQIATKEILKYLNLGVYRI